MVYGDILIGKVQFVCGRLVRRVNLIAPIVAAVAHSEEFPIAEAITCSRQEESIIATPKNPTLNTV